MEIKAKLAKEQYEFDKDSETHLLVEIKAPKAEIRDRQPVCVLPVLDISGSMAGRKLDYLKKSCKKLIDNLTIGDYIGIVAFDSNVYDIASIHEITTDYKETLKKEISNLNAGSATNISGGLLKAFEYIDKTDLPDNIILRVILFTDGQANVGIKGRDLLGFVAESKKRASVSMFGFGTDCSQDLLADLATRGEGNYAYIDSADACLTTLGRELGGLLATYAQDIKVSIMPDKNNSILEILNDESVKEKDNGATIELRDILIQEAKYLVAKVKLDKVESPLPRKVNAFKVEISFVNREGKTETLDSLSIKTKFCKVGEEPKEEDADVIRHRDRLLAGRAQDKAEEYARVGNWKLASLTLTDCANALDNQEIKFTLNNLSTNYTADCYKEKQGITNSTRSLFKGKRVSNVNKEISYFYSSAGGQNFDYVDNMVKSFTDDEIPINTSSTSKKEETSTNISLTSKKDNKDW